MNLGVVKLCFRVEHLDHSENDEANSKIEIKRVFHQAEWYLIGTQIEAIPHELVVSIHIEISAYSVAREEYEDHQTECKKGKDVELVVLAILYEFGQG